MVRVEQQEQHCCRIVVQQQQHCLPPLSPLLSISSQARCDVITSFAIMVAAEVIAAGNHLLYAGFPKSKAAGESPNPFSSEELGLSFPIFLVPTCCSLHGHLHHHKVGGRLDRPIGAGYNDPSLPAAAPRHGGRLGPAATTEGGGEVVGGG